MSYIDEDELECQCCGNIGLLPDGSFQYECTRCGATVRIDDEDDE